MIESVVKGCKSVDVGNQFLSKVSPHASRWLAVEVAHGGRTTIEGGTVGRAGTLSPMLHRLFMIYRVIIRHMGHHLTGHEDLFELWKVELWKVITR